MTKSIKKYRIHAMSGNTFGTVFKVTTFGESHGTALGCVIDGLPAGIDVDENFLQAEMDRRKPGTKGASVTARKEDDAAKILSGIFEGKTTGCPIAVMIENTNQHSKDYSSIMNKFRPGHADYTFEKKFGIRDYRGGGRSSGRETCARVAAGAFAKMYLSRFGIDIKAYTKRIAGIECKNIDFAEIENNTVRAADKDAAVLMENKINETRMAKDSIGAVVECVVKNVPVGLGQPVFDKIDALLAHAMLSIGAVKGIEFGAGFEVASMTGSINNDSMTEGFGFATNNAGGILGGMSNGNDIVFRVAVKPVPSIYLNQKTVDKEGNECDLLIEGRHDVCLAPRIVPVIEAMTAITLVDLILQNQNSRV